ncbi:hypothetical protein [Pediococcus pentosaceus]|uniref:hypothetical protein n=1 Tax=Pediococcus pentosaceus TaxID=1255 RepID=UPI001330782F|nr:hypothetical protein [Pediococcus pentosaceus]KAF0504872.1 hypothetical protein GBP24_09110 [Pediococcus pentosaceus]
MEEYNLVSYQKISLQIMKDYFLGLRALGFPNFQDHYRENKYQSKDLELFVILADFMEKLPEIDSILSVDMALSGIEEYLKKEPTNSHSRIVQIAMDDITDGINKYKKLKASNNHELDKEIQSILSGGQIQDD